MIKYFLCFNYFDTLSIAFGVPKYKNGCALVIKIPGLSKVVSDLLA